MNPRAVVILCDGASASGGTERVAIGSALGLADRGWRVGFFGAEGALDPRLLAHPNIEAETLDLSDAYHAGKAEVFRRFFYFPEAGGRFAAFLKSFDPARTVVHVHAFRRIHTAAAVRAARNFPRVMTLHDFGLVDPNTGFYDFARQAPCPLRPLSAACFARQCTRTGWPGKAMQMGRGVVNGPLLRVAREFDRFLHVSDFAARIMEPHLPTQVPSEVLPNPVEVEPGPRVRAEANADFVFVGRLQAEKGPVLFAHAGRSAGVPALFVGDGPEREAILAANTAAEITGWLSPAEVAERVVRARACVFPSRWYETAGLAALEALARGVPVIVSDVSAASEAVHDGETGRVFRSGDAGSLADAIRSAADGETVRRWSEAAHARYWSAPLTMDRHLDRLERVYERMLRSSPADFGSVPKVASPEPTA